LLIRLDARLDANFVFAVRIGNRFVREDWRVDDGSLGFVIRFDRLPHGRPDSCDGRGGFLLDGRGRGRPAFEDF
jgi:hypothetical protein